MKTCRTCLYPDTKPDLYFDETGQCSACINHHNQPRVDWAARHKELLEVLDKHDGRVIVASSGGKDSTYIALRLKELGADVTAVTATTCMLTELGRKNLDNLARHVRTIEVTPNMTVRAKLNRLGLQMVGDVSWPEHAAIHRVPFKMARDLGLHAIFYGECPNNQYGGPPGSETNRVMTQRWAAEFAGFLGLRASDLVGKEGITERDMADYTAPSDEELRDADVTAYFLGAFESWDSHRNVEYATRYGFTSQLPTVANWWAAENLDCGLTGIHDYLLYRKYRYGRGCAQISVDVRSGRVDLAFAREWVKRNDGLFPELYAGFSFHECMERIGLTHEQFNVIAYRFTNWELFNAKSSDSERSAADPRIAAAG